MFGVQSVRQRPARRGWTVAVSEAHLASHTFRDGQPAAIQSLNSSTRHLTVAPMRTGAGHFAAACHLFQVAKLTADSTAASRARASAGGSTADVAGADSGGVEGVGSMSG